MSTDLPAVLTVEEAARYLRISRGLAFDAARRGDIPTVRIGRRILVPTASLLAKLRGEEPSLPNAPGDDHPSPGKSRDSGEAEPGNTRAASASTNPPPARHSRRST